VNTNNGVEWRRFIEPKQVEHIKNTYKSNKIKVGVNDMTVNDVEMCEMTRRSLVNTGDISPEIAYTRVRVGLYARITVRPDNLQWEREHEEISNLTV